MRLYQWVKNLLLLVPLLLAHRTHEVSALVTCLWGMLAFSLVASSVYVVNDLVDLEHDRLHPRKRFRPLANGDVSVGFARVIVGLCLIAASAISLLLMPMAFTLWLATYAVVTSAYSFVLKRIVLVDVITLAGLYALRVAAGGAAANVEVSPWLLGFSLFLFMSLAFLKRYAELRDTIEREGTHVSGRGYHVGDSTFVLVAGTALGFVAVMVFTMYVNGPQVQALYTHPYRLWLIAPCLVYWVSHLWLTAQRGGMHDDPIVFAARDAHSWAVGLAVAIIAMSAT
jgi:4-hydroxybenzoate polyprenyltransferase